MTKTSVGVIIGRFQTPELHEGHKALMTQAQKHSKQLVCVGIAKVSGTPNNPLDYPTIEQMIKEQYPKAIVMPLRDQPTNKEWTKKLNEIIQTMFSTDSVTIYCGRANSQSSVQSGYQGPHKLVEIDEVPNVSATNLRKAVGRSFDTSKAFRHGVIYGATNQFTRCDPVVDVCIWQQNEKGIFILLGSRDNEDGKLRLPGGHINADDLDGMQSAKREVMEETGLEVSDLQILGQYRVISRDAPGYAMFTTLYLAKYVFGSAQANDDLDGCIWIDIDKASNFLYADDHEKLVKLSIEAIQKLTYNKTGMYQSNR